MFCKLYLVLLWLLKNLKYGLFFDNQYFITVNSLGDRKIAAQKNLTEYKRNKWDFEHLLRFWQAWKEHLLNSRGMNAMFGITYNFRLSMKYSTRIMKSTRVKIGFSCTNCFRSIVMEVFAPTTALNKFCVHSLRNKMINLVLVNKYHFDFRLHFDISKKCILLKSGLIMVGATTWYNFLSSD